MRPQVSPGGHDGCPCSWNVLLRIRPVVLLALVLAILPVPAAVAQNPRFPAQTFVSWSPAAPPVGAAPDPVRHIPPTHWKQGLVVGVALGGLLGGAFTHALCGASDIRRSCTGPAIEGALFTGALTGIVGALIGGAFPGG